MRGLQSEGEAAGEVPVHARAWDARISVGQWASVGPDLCQMRWFLSDTSRVGSRTAFSAGKRRTD